MYDTYVFNLFFISKKLIYSEGDNRTETLNRFKKEPPRKRNLQMSGHVPRTKSLVTTDPNVG